MPRGQDKLIVPTFEKREAIATTRVTRIGEISPLWQNIQSLGHFSRVYLLFGKILSLLYQILHTFGPVIIEVNGQMLKNNLAICSHWAPTSKTGKTLKRKGLKNYETFEAGRRGPVPSIEKGKRSCCRLRWRSPSLSTKIPKPWRPLVQGDEQPTELFSIRRWRLIKTQVVGCCVFMTHQNNYATHAWQHSKLVLGSHRPK